MTDAEILEGYVTGRRLPDGRLAAVERTVPGARIVVGLSFGGYEQHW